MYYQSSHVTNKLIPSDMSLIAGSYMHKFATSQLLRKVTNTNYTAVRVDTILQVIQPTPPAMGQPQGMTRSGGP